MPVSVKARVEIPNTNGHGDKTISLQHLGSRGRWNSVCSRPAWPIEITRTSIDRGRDPSTHTKKWTHHNGWVYAHEKQGEWMLDTCQDIQVLSLKEMSADHNGSLGTMRPSRLFSSLYENKQTHHSETPEEERKTKQAVLLRYMLM